MFIYVYVLCIYFDSIIIVADACQTITGQITQTSAGAYSPTPQSFMAIEIMLEAFYLQHKRQEDKYINTLIIMIDI